MIHSVTPAIRFEFACKVCGRQVVAKPVNWNRASVSEAECKMLQASDDTVGISYWVAFCPSFAECSHCGAEHDLGNAEENTQ